MRTKILGVASIVLLVMSGCSTEQTTKEFSIDTTSTPSAATLAESVPSSLTQTLTSEHENLITNDSLIAFRLEQARQHYLSAARALEIGDSVRSAQQFEHSIEILNEMSYYPEIEANQDFNDLSKTVVEDYESFIRQSGGLDSTSSVFALREKLNILSEQIDSASTEPQRFITGGTVPLVVNGLVEKHIQFFSNKRGRVHMENWLERSGKYFPMILKIFREEGVPDEMAYLAMVESGLNPVARSWARAVGLWQFMKGTGAMYGLRSNFWFDDRRDFEKATRAAALHMKDLYRDFDDWYLVMSAYNAGPGRVYRAMRRSGSNDFWTMRRHLPRETRSYVPSYIAVAIIAMNPQEYGFNVTPADPLTYDYVTVNDCVDLDVLAECAGTDVHILRELNPGLIHRSTPPSQGFSLRVPQSTDKELFHQQYEALPENKKMSWLTHVVRRGETIQKVAKHYDVSQQVLAEANSLRVRNRLKVGSRLMIPVARDRSTAAKGLRATTMYDEVESKVHTPSKIARADSRPPDGQSKLTYKVKRGDTIGHIAEWYGVRATDIRNWNNLPYGRIIPIGKVLTIWIDKAEVASLKKINTMSHDQKKLIAKTTEPDSETSSENSGSYEVRSGDTLDRIARAHGVSIEQLRRWNNLRSSHIEPGQRLAVYPVVKKVESAQAKKLADAQAQSQGKSKQIIYVVRKGDTISQIAHEYDVQPSEIMRWNSLKKNNRIYAGQELIIRKDTN